MRDFGKRLEISSLLVTLQLRIAEAAPILDGWGFHHRHRHWVAGSFYGGRR